MLSESTKQNMREDKKKLSLNELKKKYHVSKSTASTVCRDVFFNPNRKYKTEDEVRHSKLRFNVKKKRKKYLYPCVYKCGGTTTKKGARCLECYRKDATKNIVLNRIHQKTYPCKKCGTPIIKQGYCKTCRDEILKLAGEKKQRESDTRKAQNEARLNNKLTVKIDICPKSPDKRHFEIISSNKIGECKFCHRLKDYNVLQAKYLSALKM